MAVRVQEDTVVCGVPAPMRPPEHVMVVPSGESGDLSVSMPRFQHGRLPQFTQIADVLGNPQWDSQSAAARWSRPHAVQKLPGQSPTRRSFVY